jgi:hypothetical protein
MSQNTLTIGFKFSVAIVGVILIWWGAPGVVGHEAPSFLNSDFQTAIWPFLKKVMIRGMATITGFFLLIKSVL